MYRISQLSDPLQVHEAPDTDLFLKQIIRHLSNKGKLVIAEPNLHVSAQKFQNILTSARSAGLFEIEYP